MHNVIEHYKKSLKKNRQFKRLQSLGVNTGSPCELSPQGKSLKSKKTKDAFMQLEKIRTYKSTVK